MHAIWEKQYRPKDQPRGLTLDEFFGLTAFQLFKSFFKWVNNDPAAKDWDPVDITAEVNRRAAIRGEQPVVPLHMFKGVRRGG